MLLKARSVLRWMMTLLATRQVYSARIALAWVRKSG